MAVVVVPQVCIEALSVNLRQQTLDMAGRNLNKLDAVRPGSSAREQRQDSATASPPPVEQEERWLLRGFCWCRRRAV